MKFRPYIQFDKRYRCLQGDRKRLLEKLRIKKRIEELGWIYDNVGMIISQDVVNGFGCLEEKSS